MRSPRMLRNQHGRFNRNRHRQRSQLHRRGGVPGARAVGACVVPNGCTVSDGPQSRKDAGPLAHVPAVQVPVHPVPAIRADLGRGCRAVCGASACPPITNEASTTRKAGGQRTCVLIRDGAERPEPRVGEAARRIAKEVPAAEARTVRGRSVVDRRRVADCRSELPDTAGERVAAFEREDAAVVCGCSRVVVVATGVRAIWHGAGPVVIQERWCRRCARVARVAARSPRWWERWRGRRTPRWCECW